MDRYGDPDARKIYQRALPLFGSQAENRRYLAALRRLVLLDLAAGDRVAASSHLERYRAAGGGKGWELPAVADGVNAGGREMGRAEIPGPLRSFARMAAISPDVGAEDVLAALARNVVTNGYQAVSGTKRWSRPSI